MMEREKLCINCKHYSNTFLFTHYKQVFCDNEKLNTEKVNVITGEQLKIAEYCIDVRLDDKLCGWEGKWWEARSSNVTVEVQQTKGSPPPTTSGKKLSGKNVTLEDLM